MRKIVVLSGGFGGARFLRGLAEAAVPADVTAIANVGDDVEVLGMHVSPDLDSILYALAGLGDEERGWGRGDESWHALEEAGRFGGETWFQLGDRDIGLHLVRTQALRGGEPLSAVTARLARAAGLEITLLPATDDRLRTRVQTPEGELDLQTWFVARAHRDQVTEVRFEGAEEARPAPGALEALDAADLIAIAPSNPYISVWPILAVREIRAAFARRKVPAVAISPIVGGRAIKGPADRLLERMAGGTSPAHVARCYEGLIDVLVIDEADEDAPRDPSVRTVVTRTLMTDPAARRALAEVVLNVGVFK
jgi:LPPG:FO 2-phospho-L-lactate transferase